MYFQTHTPLESTTVLSSFESNVGPRWSKFGWAPRARRVRLHGINSTSTRHQLDVFETGSNRSARTARCRKRRRHADCDGDPVAVGAARWAGSVMAMVGAGGGSVTSACVHHALDHAQCACTRSRGREMPPIFAISSEKRQIFRIVFRIV